MNLNIKTNHYFLFGTVLIYGILTLICFQNVYFWDVIQLASREGHWYYETNFSSLLQPAFSSGSEFMGTAHPPLMGIMTALLWKFFGYHLWVSHVFFLLWGIVLIYQVWKLVSSFFPEKQAGGVTLLILTEATLLAQFAIVSPDFILLTAFVMAIRGVLEKKPLLTLIGFFFLCCISIRGIFAGAIILFSHLIFYFRQQEKDKSFIKTFIAYVPTLLILAAFFIYYFSERGWFFTNSAYSEHYTLPTGGIMFIFKRIFSFVIRSVENGRFLIYLLTIVVVVKMIKRKTKPDSSILFLLMVSFLLISIYIIFIFITQMPFSSRYFMPQYLILTFIVLLYLSKNQKMKKMKLTFILILFLQLTGHFWIYPEKTSIGWDCTLAHLPYYELRKECFNYIDQNEIDYNDLSAGFCLYNKRRFVELSDNEKNLSGDGINSRYFIYSNISNLPDESVDELKDTNQWKPTQQYKKWPVFITLYERIQAP